MCIQQRLWSAWASAQSEQSLRWPHGETLGPQLPIEHTAKTLIRLGGCHAIFWFCHEAAQMFIIIIPYCFDFLFFGFVVIQDFVTLLEISQTGRWFENRRYLRKKKQHLTHLQAVCGFLTYRVTIFFKNWSQILIPCIIKPNFRWHLHSFDTYFWLKYVIFTLKIRNWVLCHCYIMKCIGYNTNFIGDVTKLNQRSTNTIHINYN